MQPVKDAAPIGNDDESEKGFNGKIIYTLMFDGSIKKKEVIYIYCRLS